jgi:cell division protein FtsL
MNMSDKHELLEAVDTVISHRKSVDLSFFLYTLLTIIFVALFIFPKIYLTQQIYFKSREIAKLKVEYETLKEENKLIAASVESIKFKNQILDTMF